MEIGETLMKANRARLLGFVLILGLSLRAAEPENVAPRLAPHFEALLKIINGKSETFTLRAEGSVPSLAEKTVLEIGRSGERTFFLSLDGTKDIKGTLVFSSQRIFIDLPAKNTTLLADGPLPDGAVALQVDKLIAETVRLHPMAPLIWQVVQKNDGVAVAGMLSPLLNATRTPAAAAAEAGTDYITLAPGAEPIKLALRTHKWSASWPRANSENENRLEITLKETCTLPELPAGRKIIKIQRAEMERAMQRGGMRAIEIKVEDMQTGALPADKVVEIPGARLEIKDGQRTCFLTGTPTEMGRAHGKLLKNEIRRMADSTLYVVGFVYSITQGKWFLNEIRDAWARLEPYSDKEYLEELKGMTEGAEIDHDEMKLANVFPELFHCSGFAIAGEATVGGKLYHGRVLDYMTEIGLQSAQVDFITKRPGCRGVVNIGYAGFVGSVTGMNDAQISLGEMGGRGEGNWDGTPMAFLMRRVLDKAGTLDEARAIFENAKRTCEYYYIIADGKTRSSLGVAAWPDKIQFLKEGEKHELLPESIPGCVLLSAGDRYTLLAKRTREGFGKLDEKGAIELMNSPVAMNSNLHSVLFVPEDGIYHVAHSSCKGHKPASTQPYVRHDLKENLKKLEEIAGKK